MVRWVIHARLYAIDRCHDPAGEPGEMVMRLVKET